MAGSRRRKNVNTKRTGNTRGRNTSLSAINKNKPATQKTVVSKPKSAATNKSTVSGRALRNESARKANTGNTQRQKKTTKPQERKSFSSRMNNYQGTFGNRRKQMTAQTQNTAQDNLKKTANTMKNLTKGNIKQIAGSHATTFNSIRNPNEEMHARAEEFKRQRGDYDNQKKSPYSEGQYGQLLNRERNNKEQREKNLAKASRKIDSGTKLIEKEKEKMGEAGKFAADLYGAGLGLASDALAGPASMVSMFSRSYGSSYKTAKDEGATDSQAALYGAAAGGLEAATERLFAVAKPLQKIYGKGAGDKIFDTLLDKVAKKATSKGANDLIYHGGKTLGSFVSEALEEMIVEGLEPSIANQIYAEAVGTPHETSAKDVLYAGLLGGTMGGILGGGGQIMEYSRGEQVKDIYGEDGLKAAADRVSQADEDSGNGAMGTLVKDMISAGEDVNARYANELYRADQAQMAKDSEKLDVARTVAENSIRKENLKSPVAVDDKGEIMLSRNTKAKYDETVARAQEEADKLQVPDLTREKLAESVARIQTGTADVNDVNLFLLNNPEARTVYQVVTGESLPKTNQETRQYLYEKIGNNLITAAKIETADHADRIKGVMEQNLSTDYEVSGQEAFAQHFQGIDVRNVQQVEHDVITFDDYYRAARNGISYEQVEAYQNPIHMGADTEFKRMAYEAGQRDVAISLDTAKGMQLELGKAVSKSSLKQRSRAGKGRLISEISPEMQMEFSASQQVMYRMLARAFNINIHVVDTLQNEDGAKTNGYYVDGEVYLSLDGDRSLEYIFAHEITHHMQAYAPKEYNQLKELVRQRWAQKGGIDAAVNAKKAQYAKGGVNLSYEDALDEIIADSTYEMFQDEGFVDELCRSHRNVAQRLLDAIRDVLAKLRNVLAEGDSFTPQQNAGLLSELDILKDFERIWVNGLTRAAENRDAVGTVSETESVRYQLNTNFAAEVDSWYNNSIEFNKPGGFFKIGTTSSALQSIGVKNYDITWDKAKIKKILADHEEMTIDIVKTVPEVVENPVLVMQSKTRLNSITLFGEVYADGMPVLVAIQLNPKSKKGKVLNFAKIASAYGKNDVQSMIDSSDILYIDANKKRTDDWLSANRLQLPSGLTQYGSIGRVTYYDASVNDVNNGPTAMELAMQKAMQSSNIKFSFAGESALNADNKMLAKAKEMYNDFEGSEKIRKETGWHLGEDGKWRFEIDDSQMEVFPNGDAQFRKDHPEYVRLQELYDKFWNGELTDYEQKEFTELEETWGDEFDRLRKRLDDGNARLVDIIQHDVLFENYPTLKEVKVKAETLKNGTRGLFRPNKAEIALDKDLFRSEYRTEQRDKTLIHEIQHAIQEIENFAGGASPEYYQNKINELDENIRGAQHNLDLWLNDIGLNDFVIKSIKEMQNGKTLEQHWKDIQEFKRNSKYASQIEASEKELEQARNMYEEFTKGMTANEMYHYTAGEVEARNTADRLNFDFEQRKNTRPDIDSPSIQYSFADTVEETNQKAIDYFGETDSWEETGYLLTDGRQLDFSGRHWGSDGGGRREVDHRDIWDAFEPAGMQGFDAMMAFMNAGNIRIMPETPGIDIAVMPTSEQEEMLEEYIEYFGGDITLDIDNGEGVTVSSTTYPMGTSSSKILNDIRTYFTTGEKPYVSEVAMFRYSLKEDASITYESLVSKPDMSVVAVDENVSHDKKDIKKAGKANARSKSNKRNTDNETYVYVKDVNMDVMVPTKALLHGYRHDSDATTAVIYKIGDYLENSIKINELNPQDEKAVDAYILLGYGESETGRYPAYFVVNQYDDETAEVVGLEVLDKLYSANAKKIELAANAVGDGDNKSLLPSSSIISISELLDIVNEMYSDILPMSVAEHYGIERKKSKLGESVRYSLPDPDDIYDYINSHDTEFVEVPPVRDYERKGKAVKDKSIEELQKQVEILKRDKKLTHGKVLNKNSIREQLNILVRTLMSHSEGTANKTDGELVKTALENAEIIFKAIKDGDVYTAATTSYYAAEHIVENLKLVDDTMFNKYKDLRDYLRTTKVTISEQDRSNISDFKEFRKRNMGRILIANEGGMAVDDLYQTLCKRWPGMFDPEITHPADQLQEIADVRDQLDPYDVMLSEEETKQLIKEAAHDLLEISANGKPWQSWADRQRDVYDQKVKKLKARHVEALRDVRTKANEKADERVKAERAKAKSKAEAEKMAVAREQAEKKRAQQESQERKNAESEKRRHINRIEKDLKWLSDRLLKPTDAKHLPDGYQKAIAELLVMVDPQSARSKKLEETYGISKKRANFLRLKAEYENIAKSEAEGMIYNEDIANWCDELAKTLADADSIAEATVEEMRVISQLIKAITHSIRQQNKAFDENLKSGIAEAARETIHKAKTSRKTGQRGGIPGALGTLLNESMVSPRDFFEGIGGGINKAFMSIRKGHDKHIENITEARTFFADLFGQYANKKKPGSAIEEWRNHKTNEKIELEGGTINMNVAQKMSLYCLLKREQAAGHISGSGIVVAEASTMNKLKEALGAKKDLNFGTTRITMQEAYDIVKTLTPEQIEIADKLQDFLNGACAEWGNEASLKMFGYKKFTEENYFPIQSADVYLDSNFEGRQAVERIRNFGFTKGTVVNANNPIVIDDIFTVVADHVNKMSMYNAFAAPIADFTRVYNFKSRDDSGLIIESTKDVLANTYGKKVGRYITNFIADLQSNTQTRQEGFTRFVNKTLANYKKASIAANIRVALQQPTALVRAFTVIDPKYFVLKNHTPLLLQKATGADTDYKDMLDHCPIARWKSWGFSQVDMARDIDDIMMNKEWNKLDFVTMQLYGALDLYTWSKIWGAVRAETKAKHPEVKVDSEEFYAICNERASEVFDKTQVVDSVLHRSQVMRNTDTMSKVLTSFMAEPTRTYNMVRSEYAAAMDMWADGEKAKAGMRVAKASSVYLLNALVCAAAAAIADALRGKDLDDDDEPEEWWELTKDNFMSNASPLNLLPVFKEVSSIWKGWDTSNMALEGIEALVKAEKGIVDKLKGESEKPWSELIRKQAEAIGLVFGVPVKNILREVETWSKILGIDVFAAEVGEEVEEEKKLLKIEDGSDFDNFLNMFNINLSDKEMMDKNFDKTVKSYNKATKDMTEAEKQEYLWEKITDGYTKDIEAGDYDSINNMRRLLKETGGDYEKFNESVISRTKTEMKKTIGVDSAATEEYRYQLKKLGMTDEIINQEVVMKSDAAKTFQLEACEDDYDGMVETIRTLYDAGLTELELDVLYYNRTKAVSAKDYQTGSLVAPCNGEITSTFGYRNAPTAGASSNHKGIDIAVAANTEIVAADGGKVSSAGYNSGYGYYVKVYHGNGRYTMYAHLNGYYKDKGMAVAKGEAIGLSGSTGVSTGPHLHFEVIENGVNVDPLPYLQ